MVARTRRALLGCSTALIATLAGCGARFRKTPTEETDDVESGSVRHPEHLRLRRPGSDPPVRLPSGETTNRSGIVASADRAERLEYADDVNADAAGAFVADTDFETASIVVDQAPVEECYRIELCSVSWSREGVHTNYGRVLRDADVPCRADAWVSATTLVRVPVVLDPETVSLSGGSTRPGRCSPRTEPDDSPTGPGTATATDTTTASGTTTDGARDDAGER
ncbi:hypothetical protein BV210_09635 [Halorientalis sp. IM1011]|uniref:hypothetical protein n=1 Tax=Halorientalis sp. IM1011 TaxID=1932360 RepID=UPI00097CCC81|nr:hypothetical protein [Halorientalis sp. IM1011]AQL42960.1 hypothetical protein BV210_09635 [Halorientalis sp. IM1011]